MLAHALTDIGRVMPYRHADTLKMCWRSDAGSLKPRRRIERTGADDGLARQKVTLALRIADTHAPQPFSFEQQVQSIGLSD
nr:hypothetical protein [Novosphingobium sp. ERN07]